MSQDLYYVIKYDQKKLKEERVYFVLHFHMISIIKRNKGESLEMGTEAEAVEACCLLLLSEFSQSPFLYNPGPLLQECAAHIELLIKKMPHRLGNMQHFLS